MWFSTVYSRLKTMVFVETNFVCLKVSKYSKICFELSGIIENQVRQCVFHLYDLLKNIPIHQIVII